MTPGYVIGINGFNINGQGYGPGVMLGLNQQNTSGFSFVQLTPQGGLPAGCTTPGMGCPLNWNSQNGSISLTVAGQTTPRHPSQLPDSGIGYMIVNIAATPAITTHPTRLQHQVAPHCLPSGTVSVFLPGQTTRAAYSFSPWASPAAIPRSRSACRSTGPNNPPSSNLGRAFFDAFNYLYDPINGFVGYRAAGTSGTTPRSSRMLALQGNLALPSGFPRASRPT